MTFVHYIALWLGPAIVFWCVWKAYVGTESDYTNKEITLVIVIVLLWPAAVALFFTVSFLYGVVWIFTLPPRHHNNVDR